MISIYVVQKVVFMVVKYANDTSTLVQTRFDDVS